MVLQHVNWFRQDGTDRLALKFDLLISLSFRDLLPQ